MANLLLYSFRTNYQSEEILTLLQKHDNGLYNKNLRKAILTGLPRDDF